MSKFYDLTKSHIETIGNLIERISNSTDMREISELEIRIRKLSAEAMVYAGMIPNKDVYPITLQRRKVVQNSALAAMDRVKEVLSEEEPIVSKTEMRKQEIIEKESKPRKKRKSKKDGNK